MEGFILGVASSLVAALLTVGAGWLTSKRMRHWPLAVLSVTTGLGICRSYARQSQANLDLGADLAKARWVKVLTGRGTNSPETASALCGRKPAAAWSQSRSSCPIHTSRLAPTSPTARPRSASTTLAMKQGSSRSRSSRISGTSPPSPAGGPMWNYAYTTCPTSAVSSLPTRWPT